VAATLRIIAGGDREDPGRKRRMRQSRYAPACAARTDAGLSMTANREGLVGGREAAAADTLKGASMAVLQRELYRSARGPSPTDEDVWRLVFDPAAGTLLVRHEWETERHSGLDEFEIAEFLAQQGGAQTALLSLLFGEDAVDA